MAFGALLLLVIVECGMRGGFMCVEDVVNDYTLYHNDGYGHFSPRVITKHFENSFDMVAADFTNNGLLDLVSLDIEPDNALVWLRNEGGDSNFTVQPAVGTRGMGRGVAALDVDGDGWVDIISTSYTNNRVYWNRNNRDGTFGPSYVVAGVGGAHSLVAVDLDGDGVDDLAVCGDGHPAECVFIKMYGNGTFPLPLEIGRFEDISDVATGDLSGDGHMDLVFVSAQVNSVYVLLGHGDGTFHHWMAIKTPRAPHGAWLADIDGDGVLDIVVGSVGAVVWFRNVQNGSSFETARVVTTANLTEAGAVYAADLDGDGHMDVIAAADNGLTWYRNLDGDGCTFSGAHTLTYAPSGAGLITVKRTVACGAGRWSSPGERVCSPCVHERGFYVQNSSKPCVPCPLHAVCENGVIVAWCNNLHHASDDTGRCVAIHCFCAGFVSVLVVAVIIIAPVAVLLWKHRIPSASVWLLTLLSVGDLVTDVAYIMLQPFQTHFLKVACLLVLFGQLPCFLYVLPPDLHYLSGSVVELTTTWTRISAVKGSLAIDVVTFFFNIVVCPLLLLLWVFVGIPLMGLVGFYLFVIKVLAIQPVDALFLRFWNPAALTLPDRADHGMSPLLFHASMASELFCETIPQLVLQIINNRGDNWTTLALVSMGFSFLGIANHIYKYLYWIMCAGKRLADVPIKWTDDNDHTSSDQPDGMIEEPLLVL